MQQELNLQVGIASVTVVNPQLLFIIIKAWVYR